MTDFMASSDNDLAENLSYSKVGMGFDILAAISEHISEAERVAVLAAGREFAWAASLTQQSENPAEPKTDNVDVGGEPVATRNGAPGQQRCTPCLLISGQLGRYADPDMLVENRVKRSCMDVFGYPQVTPQPTINVLLDSTGGMLDSAFKVIRYMSWYANTVNVYVPRQAKSAGTLIALGADRIYLSPFGELGPLDTQILDPRNPTKPVSALDCYLSVAYVRQFGYQSLSSVLERLVKEAGGQIPLSELLSTASQFALGSIRPMLERIGPLDFGAWGRGLKIGERYATLLLEAKKPDPERAAGIASTLVYGYTHHLFPIDHTEAVKIGLDAEVMAEDVFQKAGSVIAECHDKSFVGFISESEAALESSARREDRAADSSYSSVRGRQSAYAAGSDGAAPIAANPVERH